MKPNKIKNKEEADASRRFMEGAFSTILKERDSTNVSLGLSDRINDMLDDAKQRGFHDMGKLNKMVAEQFAHQAVANEDEDILQFINEIKTGPKSFYGQTIVGQNLIHSTTKRIHEDQDRKDRLARQQRDDYRKELGFSLSKKYGELRNKRRKGELKGEDWEKAFEALKNEADESGFYTLSDSFSSSEDTIKARGDKEDIIDFGDQRLGGNDGLLKKALSMSESEFLNHLLTENLEIEPGLLSQLRFISQKELKVESNA